MGKDSFVGDQQYQQVRNSAPRTHRLRCTDEPQQSQPPNPRRGRHRRHRGIGRAIVEALLAEGWSVLASGRSAESISALSRALVPTSGGRLDVQVADVRDPQASERLAHRAEELCGGLDAWVNNAGLGRFAPIDELSIEDWNEVIRTNLDGAFYGMRSAAAAMKRSGKGGFILNIASLASKNPFAGGAAYNASKFGLLGMSEAAMLDLRHQGIRVATVLPGSVDTDFSHRLGEGRSRVDAPPRGRRRSGRRPAPLSRPSLAEPSRDPAEPSAEGMSPTKAPKNRTPSARTLAWRLVRHGLGMALLLALALAIGVFGYHYWGGLGWLDALENASMILGGMGPVDPMSTTSGKLFASAYAIFSGVVLLTAAGVLITPLAHHLFRRLHLEDEGE